MRRESQRRWLERGWSSFEDCVAYYRRLWQNAIHNGLKPGDEIIFGDGDLRWLVEGHPRYAELSEGGIAHFTFRPDGRGNHRFVVVGEDGVERPFSTRVALTGFDEELRFPLDDEDPFGRLKPV